MSAPRELNAQMLFLIQPLKTSQALVALHQFSRQNHLKELTAAECTSVQGQKSSASYSKMLECLKHAQNANMLNSNYWKTTIII